MKFSRYSTGGYALHRVTGKWKGYCSAWFSKEGALLDAEQRTRFSDKTRPVKTGGPIWERLKVIGKLYINFVEK